MYNWQLLICPVTVNLLSTFGTGLSTKSTVHRNSLKYIFCCPCGRAKAFAKFQLKLYEDLLEISKSFFQYHRVFSLTLAISNIYDRTTITQRQDFDFGIVAIQLVYYICSPFVKWSNVIIWDFSLPSSVVLPRNALEVDKTATFFFLLTFFWRCKMSDKSSSSLFQNDMLHQKSLCFSCQKVQIVFRLSFSAKSQHLQCRNLEVNLLTRYLCRDSWSRWFCMWIAGQLTFRLINTLCSQW